MTFLFPILPIFTFLGNENGFLLPIFLIFEVLGNGTGVEE